MTVIVAVCDGFIVLIGKRKVNDTMVFFDILYGLIDEYRIDHSGLVYR